MLLRHFPGNNCYFFESHYFIILNEYIWPRFAFSLISSGLKYRFEKDNDVKITVLPEPYRISLSLALGDFGLCDSQRQKTHTMTTASD